MLVHDRLGLHEGVIPFYRCTVCGSDVIQNGSSDPPVEDYEGEYLFERGKGRRALERWFGHIEWELFYTRGYRADLKWIFKFTGRRPSRFLDVGCGPGYRVKAFEEALGHSNGVSEGIEISERSVRFARERLGANVRQGSVFDLVGFAEYDLIGAYAVLEHVTRPREFLTRIRLLLKPGGYVVLRVPVNDSLQLRVLKGRHSHYREAPRHLWIPNSNALTRESEKLGLEFVEARPQPLLAAAGDLGMTLVPQSSYALARRHGTSGYIFWRSLGAAMTLFPGMPVAALDALWGKASAMDFMFRRPIRSTETD